MQVYLVGGLTVRNSYLSPLAKELVRHGMNVKVLALPRKEGTTRYVDYLASRATMPGVWIGHSLGTQIVQEIAFKYPEKVTSLILAGPAEVRSTLAAQALSLLHDAFYEPSDLIVHALTSFCLTGPRVTWEEAKYSKRLFRGGVKPLQCKTLVLHGQKDQFTSRTCSKKLARKLSAEFKVIPDGAHGFVFSHPTQTAQAIKSFLDQTA